MASLPAVNSEQELDLISRASAGEEAAFAQIVAAHHAEMCRVSFVICGDSDLAHDAVQQAWQIAWRKLGTVREPRRLRSWLIAVAANEARQLARRERRRADIEHMVAWPSDSTSQREDRDLDLAAALKKLKPEERALLALRYVAGLDSSQMAHELGGSASGIRTRLTRLLARLREDLTYD
jgi:RNA polymerase sigma-70 factor, ECF subfamily